MGDFKQFKNGAHFAVWLGLTPRQNYSGGKSNLNPISQWAIALRQRSGWQKAVVALANKKARILWALMTQERAYKAVSFVGM